ncbi:MAG: phenylalanine--tRNA ligase subunit beta [Longimicrobiales bacterium]
MNVSLRWLRAMVPGLDSRADDVARRLALRGAPVDGIESPGEGLDDIVVGKVLTAEPHPNADRLKLCTVDGGDGVKQVVCGAPNVTAGACYPFAPVGATLPGDFRIKKAKIRGEVSEGMLCSAKELGLGQDHDGILAMPGQHTPGDSFVEAMGLADATLDVEITANRGDLLSHLGVARELAREEAPRLPALPDASPVTLEYAEASAEASHGGVSVRIEDPDLCRRYMGAVIRGVRIGPSPAWLQERLRGAGARPINNVVDATNYIMLELGQPLHAFDLSRLAGSAIVVRRARTDETAFTTLDGEERRLDTDMLMICDAEAPVAIAGVMGGQNSEVDDATTDVLLEAALFHPPSIRATRRALGMSTDSSYRFERGVDPEGRRAVVERAVALILSTAGGSVDGPVLDVDARPFESPVVPLRLARIERLLGIPFDEPRVRELLGPLGFEVLSSRDGILDVRIPGFRSYDVTREVDLIEEVARTHGYDAFPEELGAFRPGTVPDHPLFQLEDGLRDALVAHGFYETQTPAFVPAGEGDVEVSNPLNTREPFLRAEVTPSLLRRVEYNLARGNRDVRLFELATSFRREGPGEAPREATHLAVVMTGRREPPHWSTEERELDLWSLKGLAEETLRRARGPDASVVPAATATGPYDAGAAFDLLGPEGARVGGAGRIRSDAMDLPAWAGPVWGIEFALPDPVPPAREIVHRPLPQHPASERDLALLVSHGVPVDSVVRLIRDAGGDLLERVSVFDLYEGEGVAEGTRSVAIRLRFQAADRTLKDKEVDRAVSSVLARLEEDLGVQQRG